MSSKTHHVVPDSAGGWNVKKGGGGKASKHFDKKADAEDWGRDLSQKQGTEFFIHGKDGRIQRKASHGNESPVKDRDTH